MHGLIGIMRISPSPTTQRLDERRSSALLHQRRESMQQDGDFANEITWEVGEGGEHDAVDAPGEESCPELVVPQ